MADKDNPISGKDTRVALLLDGIPQNKLVVENFKYKAKYQKIEGRPLGSSNRDIEHVPDGWEGSFEVNERSSVLDVFIDAYNLAKRNRVPVVITITHTKYYRDGTSRSYVYPDCQVDFDGSESRGAFSKQTINWDCGTDRIGG